MTRNQDILFTTEYIRNVLYFAVARPGKYLSSTSDVHYFCVDKELIYENYYSDFGPLNLGCVYKYCKTLNEKLKQYLNKQTIIHYTSPDPKKKANAAFLLGCYGVLYLSLSPRDALKPLIVHGQVYRSFQDATQGESIYTISMMDCLCAIRKARQLDFFNFQDFNLEEYERLDKIQGGDLNWIIPAKFLAFIGPVDYSVSLYHPPQMYIDYFKENNVQIVIRLNKRMYDGDVFNNAGITHYDLFFPDGSCPPRHILMKFLQIAEEAEGAIAVHCKAGLGRTGSLIGCYLIKHYRMTAHEAIGWMRICRPGSVIGHQQGWLEHLEPWLIKQGNLYRKRMFQDTEKLPVHEFGVYSISEKILKRRPVVFNKPPSSPPPLQRHTRSDITAPIRPQASKVREDKAELEEVFITSNDLTIPSTSIAMKIKGCILKIYPHPVEEASDNQPREPPLTFWQKYFTYKGCSRSCGDCLWNVSVRCAKLTPRKYDGNACCRCFDRVVPNKTSEAEQHDWRLRYSATKGSNKGFGLAKEASEVTRRISGAGEPRLGSRTTSSRFGRAGAGTRIKENSNNLSTPMPTFRTTQCSAIKTLSDAKNFLMKSSICNQQRDNTLNSSVLVTPFRPTDYHTEHGNSINATHFNNSYNSASRVPPSALRRRQQLGRSPSPSPSPSPTRHMDHTRATNTLPIDKFFARDRATIREALSGLKLFGARGGSIGAASVGAASLGACRDAPAAKPAPSVRSDERPLATQGDMLNSIKFQRRFHDTFTTEKNAMHEKNSTEVKDKPSNRSEGRSLGVRQSNVRTDVRSGGAGVRQSTVFRASAGSYSPSYASHGWARHAAEEKAISPSKERNTSPPKFFSASRPTSPKGRTRTTTFF